MQVELDNISNNGNFTPSRREYTLDDVDKLVRQIPSSKQISFPKGRMFCSYRHPGEIEWVKAAILDALNHPEKFYCPGDNFGATMKLQEMIKGNNCIVLKKWYGVPQKLEYRNTNGINSIVDANNHDEIIIPLSAEEILDVIADLNKNRDLKDIFIAYDFHHEDVAIDDLKLFKKMYVNGKLNKIIKYICSKSNELGGFHDYGVHTIRNRVTSEYVFNEKKEVRYYE